MPMPAMATPLETAINRIASPEAASGGSASATAGRALASSETVKLGARKRSNRFDRPTYPANADPMASTTSATAIAGGAS